MNIVLWALQILLALHTVAGALWKFSNPEQTVASLQAIPHGVWLGMSGLELVCSFGLVLPLFNKRFAMTGPIAAICIAMEMFFFSAVHVCSHGTDQSQLIYWLVVAAISTFIAFGRLKMNSLKLRAAQTA